MFCSPSSADDGTVVEHVWNVMAHAQKPDLVFQRNGRVHLNWRGGQFNRLLAAEVCASAVVMVVMLDTPCCEVECKTTGYPLHSHVSPSLPLPCFTVCHQVSTELYRSDSVCRASLVRAGCTMARWGCGSGRRGYYMHFTTPWHPYRFQLLYFRLTPRCWVVLTTRCYTVSIGE